MNIERKIISALLLVVVAAALVILHGKFKGAKESTRQIAVTIEGNIKKPGTYYVPYGTTRFELLKVAGVSSNSDLSNMDVYAEATEGEKISVGTLDKNVVLKSSATAAKPCVVNFFIGEVTLSGKYGSRKPDRDVPVFEGDKITCGEKATIELRLGDETLVDLRNKSELTLASLYKTDETGMLNVTFHLAQGQLWTYVKPQPQNVRFQFTTPFMTAEIKGTELELTSDSTMSAVKLTKGILNLIRAGSDRKVIITEGQKAVVSRNPQEEVALSNISGEEQSSDADLKAFREEKGKFMAEQSIRRILFIVLPDVYILTEINPGTGVVSLSRISPYADVSDYVEGVNDLGKVFLYGGVRLAASIVERLSHKRLEHYAVVSRENAVDVINRLGGVYIDVDNLAADKMVVQPGFQKLDGAKVKTYIGSALNLGMSTPDRAEALARRQNQVLHAIFDAALNNKITFSVLMFAMIFNKMDTDMEPEYGMSTYKIFKSKQDWRIDFNSLVL
jgi:hypothetical protein